MKKEKILKILQALEKKYTRNEIIELKYINNYTLLLAVLLSAQATDKGVNKATEPLFKIAKTPQEILNLGGDDRQITFKAKDDSLLEIFR